MKPPTKQGKQNSNWVSFPCHKCMNITFTTLKTPFPRYFTKLHQWNLEHRVKVCFQGGFPYHIISTINNFHALSRLHKSKKYHALSGLHKHPPPHTTNNFSFFQPILHLLTFFTIFPLSPQRKNMNENDIQWSPYSKVLNHASPTYAHSP